MDKRSNLIATFLLLIVLVVTPTPTNADRTDGDTSRPTTLIPSNTVLVSNKLDERFSKDFSVFLKHLRLEWIVLDNSVMPGDIQDKNLILIGHPDSEFTGQIMRGILSDEDLASLQVIKNDHLILEKESPWADGRTIYICSGAEFLDRRNAAEELIRAIVAEAPPASNWIRTAYDYDLDEDVRNEISHLQYPLADPELPLQDLMINVEAKPSRKITSQEAVDDVDRLFYLLSHGYSGYAFFNQNGEFELAKKNILEELSSQSSWSSDAFAGLLHEHLSFIVDFHMSIGTYKFAEHSNFWYATDFDLTLDNGGYQFEVDNKIFTLDAINDADPTSFILPSLNQQGEPIYRLGLLSTEKPPPLMLTTSSEDELRQFEINLESSDFDYYSKDVFREDIVGGIPVIRVRGFGDSDPDDLTKFVETGKNLRGEAVVIVDVRGNGGGNERWPSLWIQGLTGKRPVSVFVFSELESKTSMIGRANAFVYWGYQGSDPSLFSSEAEQYTNNAESIENGNRQTRWTSPRYPRIPLINNDTTVVVITNDFVASAGEGFVMRMSQAENVVVVGENTMGALTFGNISTHKLPNSKLMVWLPINLNLFPNGESREGLGLAPDLWVPAADAVNYAVAAIRHGTITTNQPIPQEVLDAKFNPESPFHNILSMGLDFWAIIVVFASGSAIWANFMRKKPRIILAIGLIWFLFGLYFIDLMSQKPIGYGLLCAGIINTIWGGRNVLIEGVKSKTQTYA